MKKQGVVVFLASVAHETGGLVYIEEIDKVDNYCDPSQSYGCLAGDWMAVSLLNTPGLAVTDATISWKPMLRCLFVSLLQ